MTEEEAKTKWCPHVRPLVRDDEPQKCIASECMMWRTGKMKISEFVEIRNGSIYKESYEAKDIGWCGLAGRPE